MYRIGTPLSGSPGVGSTPSAELTRACFSVLRGWRSNCTYMYSGECLCWRETPSPH
ncbi:hypothetical protein CGRA01v4_09315 [Colletotrichum graminicola]|nr:hypothetical protein CGRA01v4_09315 [Colletotrichum graminicola]